ncbi:MAG: class I fructose-bisphosphate aldolase [Thermoproteota archaeon]
MINEIEETDLSSRPRLGELTHLGRGRMDKLYRMLYANGPGGGTFLSLPFDHLVEHGGAHTFKWKKDDVADVTLTGQGSADPRTVIELVNQGIFSAVVLHPGIVDKYQPLLRPDMPLIYKIDGHMSLPHNPPIHSTLGSVKDALRLGATAVGMSFYPGSEKTREDMERVAKIIREAHNLGMPAVVWSYARGPGVSEVGNDSLYWVHYACVVAESLGADIIKTKFPAPVKAERREAYFSYLKKVAKKTSEAENYIELEPQEGEELTEEQHTHRMKVVVDSVPRSFVVVSGGPKIREDPERELVQVTRIVMNAGAEGRIIGRNFWGVPIEKGLKYCKAVSEVMNQPKYYRNYKIL